MFCFVFFGLLEKVAKMGSPVDELWPGGGSLDLVWKWFFPQSNKNIITLPGIQVTQSLLFK